VPGGAGLIIVQDHLAVAEGAALGVLAGQPYGDAILEEDPRARASAWPQSIPALLQ